MWEAKELTEGDIRNQNSNEKRYQEYMKMGENFCHKKLML